MRTSLVPTAWIFSLALSLPGTVAIAQDGADAVLGSPNGWQRYDWLSSSTASTSTTSTPTGGKVTGTAGQNLGDPFATITDGALWQENYGVTYAQPLAGDMKLVYETDAVTLNESSQPNAATDGTPDDLSHEQKAGIQVQPLQQVTLGGNVHASADDAGSPNSSMETRGAGLTAQTQLPMNSTLTLNGNSDTTTTGSMMSGATTNQSYDAQFKVPLGKLPLTAQVKGAAAQTGGNASPASNLSLDQSLTWKPADATTVQMGLRQQQYQSFPGISNALNEAVFADWAQTLVPEITWHSYAEVLTSRTQDVAPAAPATTGTNGTPQSADPTNSMSLPNSITDQTVTFTTGPSFKLDRDVSASVEYSNRIDTGAQAGNGPQDQRVSVSLKGTF